MSHFRTCIVVQSCQHISGVKMYGKPKRTHSANIHTITLYSIFVYIFTSLCLTVMCAGDVQPCGSSWCNNEVTDKNISTNIVCYLSMGSKYSGSLPPALNVTLCSHVILLGTTIKNSYVLPSSDFQIEYFYKRVVLMKKLKPSLKVLLSNGGDFTTVMASAVNRQTFSNSIIPYLSNYSIDGFDLDWEFPAWGAYRHLYEQKHNFSLVLQQVRETMDNYTTKHNISRYLLTAAVASTTPLIIACYEIPQLAKYLDFINLMTYDIHGFSFTTPFTGHNSPMYSGNSILDRTIFYYYNMVSAAETWVKRGMAKSQVMIGIPTYGHTFELLIEKSHGVYSLAEGYSKTLGDEISYNMICKLLKESYTEIFDGESLVPYAYSNKTWISFDNEQSVTYKAKWIKENGYSGVMTFSLDSDDYSGTGCGTKWPMHNAINKALK